MDWNVDRIPEAVIRRLPKYYRYLRDCERNGEARVSSAKMSKDMGLNASQIRRDLNCFGGFGQQGYGYSVPRLKSEIARILGLHKQYNMIIIGAGNMGHALMRYTSFTSLGFRIVGVFDNNPDRVGADAAGYEVRNIDTLEEFVSQNNVTIAAICTPSSAAQSIANRLVRLQVKGIWNFAPCEVRVEPGVFVENVQLNDSLYVLCYRINAPEHEQF